MPAAFADLHLHSRCSDGLLAPAELVVAGVRQGATILALTDHDTLDGIAEFLAAGQQHQIRAVAGVEITGRIEGREVHLLGYFGGDNWRDPALQTVLRHSQAVRARRIHDIVARLNERGIALTTEDVLTGVTSGSLGRPHVAAALVRQGLVRNVEEAFERFLKRGRPGYVERYRMTARDAIQLVRRAGGLPVLAHPGITGVDDRIGELVAQGLAGLEVWHPQHSVRQAERYAALAREWQLLPTGGSDSHGAIAERVDFPLELAERFVAQL